MAEIDLGVLGGSGFYQMAGLQAVETVEVETPFGKPSDKIVVGTLAGARVAFLARHGRGHRLLPTEVPYRANIYAFKQLGVRQIVSVSACGSLREHRRPGEVVVPDQLFDQTRRRDNTFFGGGLAAHVSVADPFCPHLSGMLAEAVVAAGGTVHRGGRLITIEGPRFSTRAESHTFRQWNMDVINMTTCPEAFLAREAEICYAVMNHVTDYDVWHESEEAVSVEMVIRILQKNARLAQEAIAQLAGRLAAVGDRPCACHEALASALITSREMIPEQTRERLGPLVSRYL